jgi:hypothetical protein
MQKTRSFHEDQNYMKNDWYTFVHFNNFVIVTWKVVVRTFMEGTSQMNYSTSLASLIFAREHESTGCTMENNVVKYLNYSDWLASIIV